MSVWRKAAGLFFCLFISISMCGCMGEIYKDYNFFPEKKSYPWGELEVVMQGGGDVEKPDGSVFQQPYTLFVFFTINDAISPDCFHAIENLSVSNVETGGVDYKEESAIKTTVHDKGKDKNYNVVSFVARRLYFDYTDKMLALDFSFRESCGIQQTKYHESILLKKDYRERNVTLWDIMMGV